MLHIVGGLAMAACVFFVVLNARAGRMGMVALELGGFVVLFVNDVAFRRHRRVVPATVVAAVAVAVVVWIGAYEKGAGVLAMFAPHVLVSFYLLGRRYGGLVSVGVVSAIFAWMVVPPPAARSSQPALHIVLAVGLVAVIGYFYEKLRDEHAKALVRLSTTDPLTGAFNRRSCLTLASEGLARLSEGHAMSVALFDVDHFKRVNDGHGHGAGDDVLCEVARRIRGAIRGDDALVRWGGEEFLVVLPLADAAVALQVAERIRRAVAAQPMGPGLHVRISGGVATAVLGDDLASLVQRADRCLYRAKEAGRNRICMGDLPLRPPSLRPPTGVALSSRVA